MQKYKMIVVAILFFVLTLSGCQSESFSPSDIMNTPLEIPTVPVELNIWGTVDENYLYEFNQILFSFNQYYPNIKINYKRYSEDSIRTNLASLAGTASEPDIIYAPGDVIGYFAEKNLIINIDNIISPDLKQLVVASNLNAVTIGNQTFGFPELYGNNNALIYNSKIVKKIPENIADISEISNNLQSNESPIYGLLYDETDPIVFMGFYNGYGGEVLDSYNRPTLNNRAMVDSLQLLKSMTGVYHIGFNGMTTENVNLDFMQSKSAMVFNGGWAWKQYRDAGIEIGIAPKILLPNDKPMMFYSTVKAYGFTNKANSDITKQQAINLFIDFFVATPKNNSKLAISASQIPSCIKAAELKIIKENKAIQENIQTIQYTKMMPISTEMTIIWDVLDKVIPKVLYEELSPIDAAAEMQVMAEKALKRKNQNK